MHAVKWRTTMTTATATHDVTAEHIKRFEKKITDMRRAFAALPTDDSFETLLKYIHNPGWTTLAESTFFEGLVDSMTHQTQQLTNLHKQLMAGAEQVGR
jgi:hypothetical protein